MALTLVNIDTFPTYIALSTDIAEGKIDGAAILVGRTVYLTDSGEWKIITAGDGTVANFLFPQVLA